MFLCLREDLKENSGGLKDFCLPVSPLHFPFFSFLSFFLNGPRRTVMCSLYIYTSQCLKENFTVRCIIFSLRTDVGKQTITFVATNNNTGADPGFFERGRCKYDSSRQTSRGQRNGGGGSWRVRDWSKSIGGGGGPEHRGGGS